MHTETTIWPPVPDTSTDLPAGFDWPRPRGLAVLVLVGAAFAILTATPAAVARSHRTFAVSNGWTCHAEGYSEPKNVWHTISGGCAASKAEAMQRAQRACRDAGLRGCRKGGCWRR